MRGFVIVSKDRGSSVFQLPLRKNDSINVAPESILLISLPRWRPIVVLESLALVSVKL
jgi:hypothetical protein